MQTPWLFLWKANIGKKPTSKKASEEVEKEKKKYKLKTFLAQT